MFVAEKTNIALQTVLDFADSANNAPLDKPLTANDYFSNYILLRGSLKKKAASFSYDTVAH